MKTTTQLAIFMALYIYGFKAFTQQTLTPPFELESLNNQTVVCDDSPASLRLVQTEKNFSFKLLRNGELFQTPVNGEVLINHGGIYTAIVDYYGVEIRTNDLILQECPEFNQDSKVNINDDQTTLISARIESLDYVLCGNQTEAHLEAYPKGNEFEYKWYFSTTSSGIFEEIIHSTSDHLSTDQLGYYKVMVTDGQDAPGISSSFQVVNNTYPFLTDENGSSYSTTYLSAGDSLEIHVITPGLLDGPLNFTLYKSYTGSAISIQSTENPAIVKIPILKNSSLYLLNTNTVCGSTIYSNGNLQAITDPEIDVLFDTQLTQNVCAGQLLEIPYSELGNWGLARAISYSFYTLDGSFITSSSGFFRNPLEVKIPDDLESGETYRLSLSLRYPIKASSNNTNIYLNVTSAGCQARPIVRTGNLNVGCEAISLYTDSKSGNTYQWYLDNVLIPGANSYYLSARQSGNYKVNIQNIELGYNQTSQEYAINITGISPEISSADPTLCNKVNGTSISLSSSNSSFVSYQWKYSTSEFGSFIDIPNANSSTYQAKLAGLYKLYASSTSGCITSSNAIEINNNGGYTVSDLQTGNTSTTQIYQGQTATLQIAFTGEPPYSLQYTYDSKSKAIYSTTNQYLINVSPLHNTQYLFTNFSNGCGTGSSKYHTVMVNSQPGFTLGNISSSTYCPGSRVSIPYYTSGAWGSQRQFNVTLIDQNGNYVSNSSRNVFTTNSEIIYDIDPLIPVGNYFIRVSPYSPVGVSSVTSSYSLNLVDNACTLPPARVTTSNFNNPCLMSGNGFEAYPKLSNATYYWYFGSTLVSISSSNYLLITSNNFSTDVSVRIEQTSSGYNSTSPSVYYTLPRNYSPSSNYTNVGLCSPPTTIYTTSSQGASYEWFKSQNLYGFEKIPGANSFSYLADETAIYRSKTSTPDCEILYDIRCLNGLYYEPAQICKGGSFRLTYDGPDNTDIQFQLINASNNQVVVESLLLLENPGYSFQRPIVIGIPEFVPAGSYKVRMILTDLSQTFTGAANITVLNKSIISPPSLSSNPESISSFSSVQISASGCTNDVLEWSSFSTSSSPLYVQTSPGSSFSARCLSFDGCSSEYAKVFVDYDCTDSYEPNDTPGQSELITSTDFESELLCLKNSEDADWFSFTHNGRQYFVEITLAYRYASITDQYTFKKVISGSSIILTTEQTNPTVNLDTYMKLYDDQNNLLAQNDDGNSILLSKIIFAPANPCQGMVELQSPTFDLYSQSTSLIRSSDYINATNIQYDNSINVFEAAKAIELKPGFETKITTMGVFKTEIKNCVD